MGVNLKDLFERKEIQLSDLSGKIIAVDTFNMLYQFLTSIRTPDGQLLTDHQGHVTSHLIGLLNRCVAFLEQGIKPIFVFDGTPPKLKTQERQRRSLQKEEAEQKYTAAAIAVDIQSMRKFAARTTRLDTQMITDAKQLITLLGIPIVQAPSEGEAQCAHIVRSGKAWAVASQYYDSLLHEATVLIQNLSLSGKRKIKGVLGTVSTTPLLIHLKENLKKLSLSQDQLIALAMLVGTDYNPGGIHGIGPKKALKLVHEKKELSAVFASVHWNEHSSVPWEEIFDVIKHMPVQDVSSFHFGKSHINDLFTFLVHDHGFDEVRTRKTLELLSTLNKEKNQKGLVDFT